MRLAQVRKHAQLGLRWVKCGWRLFRRNPWLLGGMGFCAAAVLFLLALIPLIGDPLIGLLAPFLGASFFIAVDGIARQRAELPPALRLVALKRSPKEFLNVSREENRLLQVVLLGLCSLVAVVLADIVVWFVAGTAWATRGLGTGASGLALVIVAGSILFASYLLLAASLVYTLPLALLQQQPLVPAMAASLTRSAHYVFALLVVLALLAAPLLLGALVSFYARPLGYLAGLAASALALPLAACSLYCSYRTVFPALAAEPAHQPGFARANQAG